MRSFVWIVSSVAFSHALGACGRTDTVGIRAPTSDDDDSEDSSTTVDDDDTDTTTTTTATSSSTTFPDTTTPVTTFTTFETDTSSSTTFIETDTVGGFCGDGVLDPNEECDPGDPLIGPGQECRSGCVLNFCGDGDPGPNEECDDGNFDPGDGCDECVLTSCGDGNVDPFEECDDGNDDDNDGCLTNCRFNICGDGFVRFGFEECDDGDLNSPFNECTPLCTQNVCGDGFQLMPGEQCDPGAGNIGPGNQCLDGCILNVCGDGDQWAGEQCDDGNMDNTDDCAACQDAECGDGFVWQGNEDCDDSNAQDFDRCHNDCSFHRVTKIALGGNHTCALFDSELIQCWGNAHNGRTGQSSEVDIGDDEPASAGGFLLLQPVVDLAAGLSHTCVIHPGGEMRCFGRALEGQLGYGNIQHIGDDEFPATAAPVPIGSTVATMNTRGGAFHNCAFLGSGELKCWGINDNFQLGIPGQAEPIGDDETAATGAAIQIGAGTITEIAAGSRHSCVLFDDGRVRCFGEAVDGALGYGNTNDIGDGEFPMAAGDVPVGATASSISAGYFHTCAVVDGDNVRCWGRGTNGRLGYGSPAFVGAFNTPADVGDVSVGAPVVQVAAGLAHTCVLTDTGAVRCWGFNDMGQLGYAVPGDIGDNELPSTAGDVPLGGVAVQIAADGNHTCAVLDDGAVRCWGHGGDGRLGYGNTNFIGDNETPASVGDVPLFP